ncbi:MAG: hypothetical protein COX20_03095 [Desulfobacterales bacterium CG23_combo_of_CG06-09_8_20_14_all_52_9]|nr:MAG: hypothetical protein COX20_03095 [Desulfobacterales bacterium CG23_combo_of_CG06-09_8_20_14_all_52_9]
MKETSDMAHRRIYGTPSHTTRIKRHFFPAIYSGTRGFTLIEILLAFFIFSIVAATVFGSYRSVFSSAETVLQVVSDDETGLSCMHRMVLDLTSIVFSLPPLYRANMVNNEPDLYRLLGERESIGDRDFSSIRFASLAYVPMGGSPVEAVSKIRYFVEAAGPNGFVLKRSDDAYPFFKDFSPETAYVICDRVRSLTMTFFDEKGAAFDRWDSDSPDFGRLTPRAVLIRLEVGNKAAFRRFETRVAFPLFRDRIAQ